METRSSVPSLNDHVRAALMGAAVALGIGLVTWASRAEGSEYTAIGALPVAALQVARDPMVVDEPAGWQPGDPAAIVIVGGPDREMLRTRLVAELIAARVMVAELVVSPDLDDPVGLAADAYAALDTLVARTAPGMVLLYGFGWEPGGPAAVLAAHEEVKARLRAPADAVFAAHASLGAGCRVETPNWDEPGDWRVAAILQGEAIHGSDATAEIALSEAALACGLALVPTPWSNDLLINRAHRAAR